MRAIRKKKIDEFVDLRRPARHYVAGLRARLADTGRSAGRPWTVGDIVMVADGQWAVRTAGERREQSECVVERRAADGRRVELTLEELARAVGSRFGEPDRDGDSG